MQDNLKCTASVSTSADFSTRNRTTPYINQNLLEYPYNIDKVPVLNSKIHSSTLIRTCTILSSQTNSQVEKTNDYVESVESSSQVKGTSKDRVTKGKRSSSILKVLTENKEKSQRDGNRQLDFAKIFVSIVHPMFRCICSEIRSQQQLCVGFRKTCPFNRNNSQRRPSHSQLNGRHQSSVQESPQQSNKKHSFTPNKLKHSLMQSIFYLPSVIPENTFTVHVTPPQTRGIYQTTQGCNHNSRSSSKLVKTQNQRSSLPQKTLPSQSRPRTRIYQMVSMMRPTSGSARHTLRCNHRSMICILFLSIKSRKQSHCLK
jgi:hypothetical protein